MKNNNQLEKALNKLNSQISEMTEEQLIKFLTNMSSSRLGKYSLLNQAMIYSQCISRGFEPTMIGALKSFWIAKHKSRVKKSEFSKGIWILCPKLYNKKFENSDGNLETVSVLTGFKYGRVYDISQLENPENIKMEAQSKVTGISEDKIKYIMDRMKSEYDIEIKHMDFEKGGHIERAKQGEKQIIKLNSQLPITTNFKTLIHELAHSKLKHNTEECNLSRGQKEVDAETTAYLVLSQLGLVDEKESSVSYIKSWNFEGNLKPNVSEIFSAVTEIEKYIKGVK